MCNAHREVVTKPSSCLSFIKDAPLQKDAIVFRTAIVLVRTPGIRGLHYHPHLARLTLPNSYSHLRFLLLPVAACHVVRPFSFKTCHPESFREPIDILPGYTVGQRFRESRVVGAHVTTSANAFLHPQYWLLCPPPYGVWS